MPAVIIMPGHPFVGSIIGTDPYLSESIPTLHHKDQSEVHSRCLLQAPNETTYSTVGTPLKYRMLGQMYMEADGKG